MEWDTSGDLIFCFHALGLGFGCSWGRRKRRGKQAGARQGEDGGREWRQKQGRLGPEKASAHGLGRALVRKQSKIIGHSATRVSNKDTVVDLLMQIPIEVKAMSREDGNTAVDYVVKAHDAGGFVA